MHFGQDVVRQCKICTRNNISNGQIIIIISIHFNQNWKALYLQSVPPKTGLHLARAYWDRDSSAQQMTRHNNGMDRIESSERAHTRLESHAWEWKAIDLVLKNRRLVCLAHTWTIPATSAPWIFKYSTHGLLQGTCTFDSEWSKSQQMLTFKEDVGKSDLTIETVSYTRTLP